LRDWRLWVSLIFRCWYLSLCEMWYSWLCCPWSYQYKGHEDKV